MKKIWKLLTVLFACVMLAFGFAACKDDGKDGKHTHTYVETVTAPTCTEQGYTTYTCDCGDSYNHLYVDATGHTEVIDSAVPPTCTETGLTEGKHCSVCYEVIIEQQIVNKTAHTFDKQVATETYLKSAATCTAKAVYYKSCKCGEKSETQTFESGNILPHTFDQQVATETYLKTAATCTAKAVYYKSCECGEKDETQTFEYGETLPHPTQKTWEFDETYHWRLSTCSCNLILDRDEHSLDDTGLCAVCEQPITATDGVLYDASADGTYAEVIAYTGTATKVKIADTYEGLPVKNIYDNAFKNASITSIIIPDSVTSIGEGAFYYCRSLTSVVIGDSVTTIGPSAFYYCDSLTSIEIPDGVTSIGEEAFYNCDSLTSIEIPDGVTSIGEGAFSGCDSLTSIAIPDSVTSIGEEAFYSCDSLTSVEIGDSVTSIGEYAFNGCSSLQYNVKDNVKYLGSKDNDYFALIEVVNENLSSYKIDENTKVIAGRAFSGCTRLTSITIPDSVTSIGEYAFYSCDSLTSVTIGDSVTTIGDRAFFYCESLTSVTIGDSVTSIGELAFSGCYRLVEVYNKSSLEITAGDSGNGRAGYYAIEVYTEPYESKLSIDQDGYIIYTDGDDKILVGYAGSETALTLPSGITEIYKYAFYECDSLTSIVIPDSVTSIGRYAFYNCDSLTSIEIPDGVTSIGEEAFYNCDSLTSVVIPDSVTTIGDMAFIGCDSLTSIRFKGTVAEWNAIVKGYDWNFGVPAMKVVCKDGEVSI